MEILMEMAKFILRFIYFFIKLAPIQNKITFLSRQSNNLSIDFMLLRDEIIKEDPKVKIKILNKKIGKKLTEKVSYGFHMLSQMYQVATSKVVVIDGYQIVISVLKHKKTLKVVQMWHALGSLKKFGYSIMDKAEGSKQNVIKGMQMHKNYDVVLASSKLAGKNFAEAFNVNESQIETLGLPRIDFLLSKKYAKITKSKIYDRYPELKNGRKNILYVPTFRKNGELKEQEIVDNINYDKYNLILKLHSGEEKIYVKTKNKINTVCGNIATGMEFLHIANVVITDYSAICFEAAIMNKPIYFYVYDYEKYIDSRSFYIDFTKEMPGFISKDGKKIIKAVEDGIYYPDKNNEFVNKYIENVEANHTKELAEFVLKDIQTKDVKKKIKKLIKKEETKTRKLFSMINFVIMNRTLIMFTKIKSNRVLFMSDVRVVMDGNLKFVYDKLDDKKYEKIVIFKRERREKRDLKEKFKAVYYLSTSKYVFLDDTLALSSIMKVRKGQELCQLWHGPGAYKKFGFSRENNEQDKLKIHTGYKKYTKAITSAEGIRECYSESFRISKDKVKATGIPRTDIFFDKKYIEKKTGEIYKELPFLKDKKIIMFAPTYRGTRLKEATYDFDKIDLEALYRAFSKDYVFIFKWHPAVYNNIIRMDKSIYDLEKYKGFFYDLSANRDINDLLLITDVLITDYSSVIFDYALLNKPVVYYTYDLLEYEGGRGLFFDFKEYIYGKVTYNMSELINAIKKADMFPKERKVFINKFMSACDGASTDRVCKWVMGNDYNKK